VFDNLTTPPVDDMTLVNIAKGWVDVLTNGATNALPEARFMINGGGLVLSAATAAGGTNTGLVQVTGVGGTMEGRAYGANAASGAITVRQSGLVTIDAGAVLTTLSAGNYDLKFTGEVTGAGEFRTTAGKVSTDAPLTVHTVWAKGGNLTVNGTATVNTLEVEGGRLNANSLLTATNVTVTNNGILSVDALGALMGLPNFTVATGSTGPGWLNFGVAQTDIPIITVEGASVVTGDTANLRIRGFESPDQASGNLILKNSAAFYGTLEPTTDQLGSGVRLQAALTGNDLSRVVLVGDDGLNDAGHQADIYSGAIYGIWSRTNHEDPATGRNFLGTITDVTPAQTGIDVNINNEITALDSQARFNTTNTDTGVRFFGPGKLTMNAPVGGIANTFSRTGTSADLQNNILVLNNGSVDSGDHWLVANGRIILGGVDAFVDKTSHLTMQAGSTMSVSGVNPNHGTFDVLPGAIVSVGYNQDVFMKGAANEQWNFTPGVPTVNPVTGARNITPGGMLAFTGHGFNPADKNWPNKAQFIFCDWDENGQWGSTGFPVGNGAYLTGMMNDNVCPAYGNQRGIVAAAGAQVGDTVGFAEPYYNGNAGDWWNREMEFQDAVDLRIGSTGGPSNAMNLVIGNTNRMTTINGGNWFDITRSDVPMSGRVMLRATTIANDVHVQSGLLDFEINVDTTGNTLVPTKSLQINNLYSWGGWRPDDGDGTSWHGGANISFRYVDNFNVGGRSIAGSVYSRGGYTEILNDWWMFQNAMSVESGPTAFADKIVIGDNSRLFIDYHRGSDVSPMNPTQKLWNIKTPIEIEAETSHAKFGWNLRLRREWDDQPAGFTDQVFVNRLILDQGAVLSVRSQWENGAYMTANLELKGDATATRRWNGWEGYQDDSWDYGLYTVRSLTGGPVTLTMGETGQPGNLANNIYGQIGDAGGNVTMKMIRSNLAWQGGSIATGSVVDDRGIKFVPGFVDAYQEMWGGASGGVSMYDAGGTILLGSNEDLCVRFVNSSLDPITGKERVNKVLGHIEVVSDNDPATNDAILRVQSDGSGAFRGVAYYGNVHLDNGAQVHFEDWSYGNVITNFHSNLGNTGIVLHDTDVNRFYYGDVGKPGETGAIRFIGNQTARFFGNVYGELIWDIGQAAPSFPLWTDPMDASITVTAADLGYNGFALAGGTLNMAQSTLTMSNTIVAGVRDIGIGKLKTSGSGTIIVPEPASIPKVTGLIVAGGTMRVQSDSATAWTQPVTATGTGSGTLQVEPVTTGGTGQAQSFPSLTFQGGTPGLTVTALNGATASFGYTDVLASATAARLVSQIPNLDIGPVTIAAGANLKLGSVGIGSIRTPRLTGPGGVNPAGFSVGPMGGSSVTITDTAADFQGNGYIEAGTLHLAGPSLVYNGTLKNDATLHVPAGGNATVNNFITSTTIGTGTSVTGLMGNYYNYNSQGNPDPATGNGWHYFANATGAFSPSDFMNNVMPVPTVQQLLNTQGIDFAYPSWADQSGNPFTPLGVNINVDNICAMWQGYLTVPTTGHYDFGVNGDDGKIVILNDQIVSVDNRWTGSNGHGQVQVWGGDVALTAGVRYPFLAGFFEGGGGASVEIHWRSTDAGVADSVIPVSAFSYGAIAAGGTINVDALGSLTAPGFTQHQNVNVNGTLTLTGPGDSDAMNGLVTGSLIANGGQDVRFKNSLTVSGAAPSINVGAGTLRVGTALVPGTANINTPFAFNATNKTTVLGAMNVAANPVTLDSGAVVAATTLNVAKNAKLAVNNGSVNTIGQVEIAAGGSMDLNNAGNQNGMAAIHNLGTVTATAGTTDLSSTVITSTKVIVAPTGQDIGGPGRAGSWSVNPGTGEYSVTGSGGDIWGTADQFYYLSAPLAAGTGTTMQARVVSLHDVDGDDVAMDGWTKAGLMIRDDAAANAAQSFIAVTKSNNSSQQRRPETGWDCNTNWTDGLGNNFQDGSTAPYWLKMVYDGTNQFTAYVAPDSGGTPGTWTMIRTLTVNMTGDNLFGLAVTSHNNGRATTAVIDNFSGFGQILPGDITVAGSATLKVKGFTTANTVTVGPAGRLELKTTNGADWSDCINLALDATATLDIGKAGLKIASGDLATVVAEITAGQITSGLLGENPTDWRMAAGVTADGVQVKVTILGDVNMDKVVDRNDLAAFTFGPTTKGWSAGDFNGNGMVDIGDYITLKDYMGRWFGDRGESVPEPATLCLLAFGLGGLLLKRRNRSK
jgi:hypothetical protein